MHGRYRAGEGLHPPASHRLVFEGGPSDKSADLLRAPAIQAAASTSLREAAAGLLGRLRVQNDVQRVRAARLVHRP